MKKILFYLPFIKVGGIEKVSIEYLNGLIEKGYDVDLIIDFDMGKDGNTFEYAIPKEVDFQYIKSEQVSKFIYYAEENMERYNTESIIDKYDSFIDLIYSLKEKQEKSYRDFLYNNFLEKNGNSIIISNGEKIDKNQRDTDEKIKEMKDKNERKMIHLKMALTNVFGFSNNYEKKEYQEYLE